MSTNTSVLYNDSTGHYYQFISATGLTWSQAKVEAERLTYNGMTGYLSTITNAQELNFINTVVFPDGRRPDGSAADNTFVGGSDELEESEDGASD